MFLSERNTDPLELLSPVNHPVLAIFGGADRSMPTAEFAVKLLFLADAMDLELTVRTYSGLDHDLSSTRSPTDGLDTMGQAVIDELVQWTSSIFNQTSVADSN